MAFTFFFRDKQVLDLVVEHCIPNLRGRSRPRVWDAGAAMGQEPYSLCMMLAEKMGYFAFNNLRIHATDLDSSNQFCSIIEAGVYPKEELERLPRMIFQKYFEPADISGHFRVVDSIRSRISFQQHDLLTLKEIGHGFSLILCKNVLLHFQPAERLQVIKMFHRALAPGGYFATEQTQKMPPELESCFQRVVSDTQLYRKVELQQCTQ